mmetsp:Transcript_36204/g.61196  ORF Transcript_36204/g.61196 Transcript_36204/m.61196 type:complete len:127 (+) Transcript_36204:94-474(+)
MGNVFGEKKSAKEIVREQKRLVNRSIRQLDREINGLKKEEKKLIQSIKKDAKANQMSAVKIMAKDLVRIRKQQTKFLNLTAQLRAISLTMTVNFKKTRILSSKTHCYRPCNPSTPCRSLSRKYLRL